LRSLVWGHGGFKSLVQDCWLEIYDLRSLVWDLLFGDFGLGFLVWADWIEISGLRPFGL